MRAMRLLFICMVLVVQFFASIIVTLSSGQILQALQTPQTLTGLISGSLSVIVMVILMGGLFLPQFDRMSRYLRLVESARSIVEHAQANEPLGREELDAFRALQKAEKWGGDRSNSSLPTRGTSHVRRRQANAQDEWPYGR